ncbi:MAG: hypothetical protein ACE15F_00075 [bacterium]
MNPQLTAVRYTVLFLGRHLIWGTQAAEPRTDQGKGVLNLVPGLGNMTGWIMTEIPATHSPENLYRNVEGAAGL